MKNFFLKTGLTLLCLIIGLGSAWGEEIVLTGASGFGSSYGTTAPSGFAGDGIMYNGNGTPNQWASKQVIQFRKSGSTAGYLYNTTPLTNITNIKIYLTAENPFNLYTGTTTDVENHNPTPTPTTENISYTTYISKKTGTGNTDVYVYDFQISSGQSYFKIVNGSSANYVYKIVITYNTTPTKTLSSIAVKTAPTQTTYTEGENFNPAGLVLTGTYSDTSTEDIAYADHASDFTFSPALTTALTTSNTSVTITYGSKTTTQSITVNEAPKHTAYFYSNGSLYWSEQYAEGAAITFPTGLSAINGKNFVGWVATEISGTQDNEPSFVTSPTMGNANVTYYAVYATQETEGTPEETLSQTLQYDTWTYSGSTTDKSSYRLFHSGSYIESAPFDLSKLSKVVVYGGTFGGGSFNSLTIGDGTNTWKSVTVSGSSQTGKNEYTEGKALSGTKSLRITSNSGTATGTGVRISKVEIYTLEAGTSYSDYCTTVDTSTPSISADDVNIAADATSGEIEYSITNAVTGKSLSANTTVEWISNIQVTADKVTFTTSANTATTERTAEITLTYDGATDKVVTVTQAGKQGDPEITNFIKTSTLELVVGAPNYDIRNCLNIPNDYDTSTYSITTTINGLTQKDGEYACVYPYIAFSKAGEYTVHVVAAAMPGKYAQTEGDITVTVTDPAPAITTIPALFTKATEVGGTDTDINLTLNNWVVSGVNGKNAYVTDGTNGFIIYQDSHGFTAGNVLNGTVACKVLLYNGAAEIKGLTSSTTGLTVTTGGTITPRTTTIGALENINVGSVITLENVSFDDPNLTDGENTIQPFTSLYSYPNTTFTQGTHYNVTGVYILYKSGSNIIKEILPRSAEDIEEVQAEKYAINIAPCENGTVTASLEEAAAGVEVTLTVTPNSGYQLSTLAVTNATTSEAITVTSNTFIMPAAAVNVAATFEEATPSDIIFYESFDDNDGTGGNDDKWSGSIASNTLSTKETSKSDWTFVKGNGADQCAKFGTGSAKGSATTPALNYTGNATLTFKAGAWNSTSEGTTLNISIEGGGSASPTSVTLTKGAWGEYTINLTGLTTTSKIKFEAANASNNRFFLDEVTVTKSSITPATEYDIIIASDIEHGTISASKAKAEEGDNITITATPATGYQLATLYYTIDGDETQNTIENLTFTMPANNVTIHATFMETITGTFTINYSVNGIIRKTETLEANASLNFPAVSSMYGKVFLGWTTSEVPGEVDEKPGMADALTATADATYYALFATRTSTGGSDELTKVDELVAGMDVILAMEEGGTPNMGISDVNIEKSTAVVSDTQSDWLKFSVNEIGDNTCLVYNNLFVTPSTSSKNMFSLSENNGTSFYINSNKHLAYMKGTDEFVLAENYDPNSEDKYYYRFYKESTINDGSALQTYTPFFVYTDGSSTTYSAYTTLPSYVKLDESTTNGTYNNETFGTVKIIRSMKADDIWNSLCLPFSMNEEQITTAFGEGTDVRELTTASVTGTAPDEVLHLNFTQVTAIEAGKLYMVRVPAAITEFYVEDTEVNTAEPAQDYSKGDYTIQTHSNYNYMDGHTNGYVPVGSFVISGNKFMQVGSSTQKMKAFRGYITATDASGNPVKALGIGFIDPLTGINNVEFNTDARIYNLQGLQQSKLQKGINIVNGKKVIR